MKYIKVVVNYIEQINALGFNNLIVVDFDDERYQEFADEIDPNDIKILTAYFRQPTWTDFNNDRIKFTKYNGATGLYEVDHFGFMDFQLRKLFAYIELEDDKIEMNDEMVDKLHDRIASYLIAELSNHFSIDDDKMRKISVAASRFYKRHATKDSNPVQSLPSEIIEVELAERFHWTLEYIRSLSIEDMEKIMMILGQRALEEEGVQNSIHQDSDDLYDERTGTKIIGGKYAKSSLQNKLTGMDEIKAKDNIAARTLNQ